MGLRSHDARGVEESRAANLERPDEERGVAGEQVQVSCERSRGEQAPA